jgi:hypothetical protein
MKKKEVLGKIEFDPRDIMRNRGHSYGAGRPIKVHSRPKNRREKQRLRREFDSY